MFWTGFWSGVLTLCVIEAVIMTAVLIFAYKGAPLEEDEE